MHKSKKNYALYIITILCAATFVTAAATIERPELKGPSTTREKGDAGVSIEFPVDTLCFQGQCIDSWPVYILDDSTAKGNTIACTANNRGQVVFIQSPAGVPDYEEQCRQTSGGTYRWVTR